MTIQERLDTICKNRQINESGVKVTITKDDFLWLVYGVDEQTEKVERYEKALEEIEEISLCDNGNLDLLEIHTKAINTLSDNA
jgi:hypothetical protein